MSKVQIYALLLVVHVASTILLKARHCWFPFFPFP